MARQALAEDLTLDELREIRRILNNQPETVQIKHLRLRLVGLIEDRSAFAHMLETGRYPTWYR